MKKWRPKLYQPYWAIVTNDVTGYMHVSKMLYESRIYAIGYFNDGNCFRTRKEAREKLKKIKEVLKG